MYQTSEQTTYFKEGYIKKDEGIWTESNHSLNDLKAELNFKNLEISESDIEALENTLIARKSIIKEELNKIINLNLGSIQNIMLECKVDTKNKRIVSINISYNQEKTNTNLYFELYYSK